MLVAIGLAIWIVAVFSQAIRDTFDWRLVMVKEYADIVKPVEHSVSGGAIESDISHGIEHFFVPGARGGHRNAILYLPGVLATCRESIGTILAFADNQYDAYIIQRPNEMNLVSIAQKILTVWQKIKRRNYDSVILVGHSFGGLVAL
jgi:hypothetical protein